jgi:hypothetical protein
MELYLCSMYTSCMGPIVLLSAGAVCVPVIIIQGVNHTSVLPEANCSIILQSDVIKIM